MSDVINFSKFKESKVGVECQAANQNKKALESELTEDEIMDDEELYEHIEALQLSPVAILFRYDQDVLDGYTSWLYFNVK